MDFFETLKSEIHKVIVGQDDVIELLLTAFIARGHAIVVGVPGVAKTLLVSTLAKALSLKFKRIQFTPDLLPSDITGTEILYEDKLTGERIFKFVEGPIFTNILLADEVNRTPPKTQSALLEAMQERQVTVGRNSFKLQEPFFVVATQNPIEQEGTYPLPEAQLDRFLIYIYMDYPNFSEEKKIALSEGFDELEKVNSIIDAKGILELQAMVSKVPVSEEVIDYATKIIRYTRPINNTSEFIKKYVKWGAGPRALQALIKLSRVYSMLKGRNAVIKEDILKVLKPVLMHRIIPSYEAISENVNKEIILQHIIDTWA
ncbi:MAG: MoxR family ATPase [bacterium]|nr:MoxR family ATPase [bacterium]